jgi:hypothetical protein
MDVLEARLSALADSIGSSSPDETSDATLVDAVNRLSMQYQSLVENNAVLKQVLSGLRANRALLKRGEVLAADVSLALLEGSRDRLLQTGEQLRVVAAHEQFVNGNAFEDLEKHNERLRALLPQHEEQKRMALEFEAAVESLVLQYDAMVLDISKEVLRIESMVKQRKNE